MEISLDDWQKEVLNYEGNICLCSGRQVGKSTVISMKAGEYAVRNRKKTIMIIAATERQAYLLFEKVLGYIHENYKNRIKTGKDRPTKTKLQLTNGSTIYCLPTGDTGYGIRGFTIDVLYADEAHFIKEEVWAAVTPMLATTGGQIILLSTPFGTEGFFYKSFYSKNFKSFHVSTEEVAEKRQEPQRTRMLEFLREEKKSMTKLQYQQEYLGLFVGGIRRLFPDDLIKSCQEEKSESYIPKGQLFQGIDVARMGGDEFVCCSVDRINKNFLKMIDLEITEGQKLTDSARLIIKKDREMNHKKIYIDDGGMGIGVYDILFEDKQTKRKVVGINNAKRLIDKEKGNDKKRKKALQKTELYMNLVNLMELGKIKFWDDPRIEQSLRSIQCEETQGGDMRVYGNYSHIAEALIRAAWCVKDKSLNIYAYYS